MNLADLPSLPDLDFIKGPGLAPGHDAFILSRLVEIHPDMRILDLGTGQGIIALMMAAREKVRVVGLDRNLFALNVARQNQILNEARLRGKIFWVLADMRHLPWAVGSGEQEVTEKGFDLVVMNPPYRVPGTGRMPHDPHRAMARFEIHGSLADWASAAARCLSPGGRVLCIHQPQRETELLNSFEKAGFGRINLVRIEGQKADSEQWVLLDGQLLGKTGG